MYQLRKKFNNRLGFIIGGVLAVVTIVCLGHLLAIATGVYSAVIIMSGTMDYVSGKLGGIVYSHKGTTMYFRKWRKPGNPHSQYQAIARSWSKFVRQGWNNILNDDDRAAWNAYALVTPVASPKTGKTRTVSGQNMYVRLNPIIYAYAIVSQTGDLPVTLANQSPPLAYLNSSIPILSDIALTASSVLPVPPETEVPYTIGLTPTINETDSAWSGYLCVAISGPVNVGRSKAVQSFIYAKLGATTGTIIILTPEWIAKYVPSQTVNYTGQKIFATAWLVDNSGTIVSPKITTGAQIINGETLTVPAPAVIPAVTRSTKKSTK